MLACKRIVLHAVLVLVCFFLPSLEQLKNNYSLFSELGNHFMVQLLELLTQALTYLIQVHYEYI